MRRAARIFFLLYLCGVVYLSLYPWTFVATPRSLTLPRLPLYSRRMVLDGVLNVLFYVPLGAAALAALRRRPASWFLAAGFCALLSYVIETAQLYAPGRFALVNDVVANALGGVLGASLAYVLTAPRFAHALRRRYSDERWRLTATGALFLLLWMLWHTFPFVPSLSLYRLGVFWSQLPAQPFSWLAAAEGFVSFLVLAHVLQRSWWLWLAFAALPAYLELAGHTFSLALTAGAAAGWIAARTLLPGVDARLLAGLLLASLTFEEFRPFHLAPQAQPFAWSPLQSWFAAASTGYYATMFRKLLLYTSVVWSLRHSRPHKAVLAWRWAVAAPMLVLAAGEWTQQYLEGRTPETTDLFLLAAGALLLAACER